MGERFYPGVFPILATALAAAFLTACGPDAPTPNPAADGPSTWFPRSGQLVVDFVPPEDGDLLPRLLHHLEKSSRDSLHFAIEQIPAFGERAAAALVAGIESRIQDPNHFGALHNYCKTLGACGSREDAAVLVRVVRESSVPLARTGAAEALGQIGGPEHVPELIRALEVETEAGPIQAYYGALGELGGDQAFAYLEDRIRDWAGNRPGSAVFGNLAWNQVLGLEDGQAAARLARVAPMLAGRSFQVSALRRRAELGDPAAGAGLRDFLDPATTPAPGTRVVAIEGLGHAGDWEGVQLGFDDPDPKLHLAAINVLSLPAARQSRVAHSKLEDLAQGGDPELAQAAMHALCLRGDRRLLEPWLKRAQTYPHGAGSVDAINLLKHEDVADPRTTPVLLNAWENSDTDSRIGLLRVFGKMRDPRCLPLFEELLLGAGAEPDLRRMALTQTANLGGLAQPLLLRFLEQPLTAEDAPHALASLGRMALDDPVARARLLELTGDETQPDWVRANCFPLLIKILGAEAYPALLEARDEAKRGEVRAFLNGILNEFF
ncbi:MAG: hypothetical protein ISR76_07700 [Planctomycetes bacterium]|nr:hypothetical protein [Planctomycetota bacterium]